MSEKLEIGATSKPRFEFRSFGQDFTSVRERMEQLSVPIPEEFKERHSYELYIISRLNDTHNIKIRDGKLDIKTYVQTVNGLEQWDPMMKALFPISKARLQEVFQGLKVDLPHLDKESYTQNAFLEMVQNNPDLMAVEVKKHRFGYMVYDTICEFAEVWIDGVKVEAINSESTEIADIQKTLTDCGLVDIENINYLEAIKRVIGMSDKPLAN
ncbi:MAG: hypothetical protein KJP00_03345 [Bacteroidia bacterium]|nr:hypothetical protein [Bacteroidia bacterium]